MKLSAIMRITLSLISITSTTLLSAQTNPSPQALPYSQDFSGLNHTSATYPSGLQGWKVSGAATTSIITTAPIGDHTLTASASASTTAGGVNNYNGKIGFLASGSTNPGIVLSISTTGLSNIHLSYDIMVIRNPYDGMSNTRINESVLQYRVGEAGNFTTITGVEYVNTNVTQTGTGVTTPQNPESRSLILPAACNNQSIVQIRWINHDQTGAGSRPSFAIDNLVAVQDNDGDTYVATNDCNDNNASINPGAAEICNGLDDNCAGGADDGLTFTTYYADGDGDGYGDNSDPGASFCADPGPGYSDMTGDCDDTENTVYNGATEICDGLDNNCNGDTDEDLVSATITPAGNVTICKGESILLEANTGMGYSYQWFKNGNAIPGATNDTYTTSKTGYFEVQVSIPGGCFAVSEPTGVGGLPNPNANISAPAGTNLCVPTVKLKASYNATYTYQWYLNDAPVEGATNYTYFPSAAGDYYCTVSTAEGCDRNTATLTVTNDCRDAIDRQPLFAVYPNPATGFINLSVLTADNAETAQMEIYNVLGEMVYAKQIAVSNGEIEEVIDLNTITVNGIYTMKVTVDGLSTVKQFMIEK